MKKIIYALIIIFIPVYAWGEYYWTDIYDEEKEIIESEDRYLWFKEEEEGIYLEYGDKSNEYPLVKEEKVTQTEYTDYLYPCPVNDYEKYDISYQGFYGYRKIKKVRYLKLWYSNKPLEIYKLIVKNKGKEINYLISLCKSCQDEKITIANKETITIDLNDYYDMENLEFNIVTNYSDNRYSFGIGLFVDESGKEKCGGYAGNTSIWEYKVNDLWLANRILDEYYYSSEKLKEGTFNYGYGKLNFCKYRSYYQYHYKIEKKYYDNNYYAFLDGYIKDENTKKTFYKYKEKEENILNFASSSEQETPSITSSYETSQIKIGNTSSNLIKEKRSNKIYYLGVIVILLGLTLKILSKKVVRKK